MELSNFEELGSVPESGSLNFQKLEFGVGVAEKATQLRSPGFIIANGLTIILLNSIFYP